MRVLQVDTEAGWRGGQRQTLLLARELKRLGHYCLVAARAGTPLASRAEAAGIRVLPVRPWSELALLSALTLRRIIRRERIQIVHAQAAHALTLAVLATLGTAARVVVTRHLSKQARNNIGTRWKYRRTAAILAVSEAAADALVASGIDRQRIEVVHGGVELDRARPAPPASELAALGIPAGAPLAVMVGALVPQKDPLTFVKAIAAARRDVPELHALLVGEGELRAVVQAEIDALALNAAVHLTGFRDDVDALLAAADVAVLSSRFEGLPLVIMDAFALGIPVAATRADGIPELVQTNHGLLVDVGDYGALGAAIARIVRDRRLHDCLVFNGRNRAAEFSIQRTAERTLAVYERLVADTDS